VGQIDAILCSGLIAPQQLARMERQIREMDRSGRIKQAELVL